MAKKIHFTDNLFYLNRGIDRLSDGLQLDLDADFYLDKMTDDILFFDSIIEKTYQILKENSSLGEYYEQMRNLYAAQKKFIGVLSTVINAKTCFTSEFTPFMIKFREILESNEYISNIIYTQLSSGRQMSDAYDVVSQDEMSALFQF